MAENTVPKANVIKAYKRRKMVFNILWFAACLFLLFGILSLKNPGTYTAMPENVEPWVFFGVAAPLFAGALYTWRCPVCGKFFWINTRLTACGKCKTVFAESRWP